MNKKKFKKSLKAAWHFVWEEDSIASWIVNIVLAFVLIKFIIFPGLGFVMQTTHPIVAVVSGSMEHKAVHQCKIYDAMKQCALKDKNSFQLCGEKFTSKPRVNFDFYWKTCGDYYENIDISKDSFSDFSFKNGFNTGDIIILVGTKPENVKIGDVIVFQATQAYPIIHRVTKKKIENNRLIFETKGDHNEIQTPDDIKIDQDQIIGKAIIRIPYLGWIKIGAFKLLNWVGVFKLTTFINSKF
jgi:signal peptidase